MKILVFLSWCFIGCQMAFAQDLPAISYKEYGFNKPVKRVTQVLYSCTDNQIEKVEKIVLSFNAAGKIESCENRSLLDESWSKSASIYKNGLLKEVNWTFSNPYLNKTHQYAYNLQQRMVEEKIWYKGGAESAVKFLYKNNRLHQADATIDGKPSIRSVRYYSPKGKLYKITQSENIPGENALVTQYYYLEGREIMSFDAPKDNFNATAYLGKQVEIKFSLLKEDIVKNKWYEGIRHYESEAQQDQVKYGLEDYSGQTLQGYLKNREVIKPTSILLFYRNKAGEILAEAQVDVKTKAVTNILFNQLNYADNSNAGSTTFNKNILQHFNKMLITLDLP